MNLPTSRLVDDNGLRYRYLEQGDPAAPAVVLHGLHSYGRRQ
jgi:hypothetical protein